MSQSYIGEIKLVGWNFACRGFSFANGNILSIQQNTALFSLLGTTYGGNGQTTFALPNLGGRTPIGQGQSPGTSNYVIGEAAGVENTTLLISNLPGHTHGATTTVTPTITPITAATTINGMNGASTRVLNPGGNLPANAFINASSSAVQSYASLAGGGGTVTPMEPTMASTVISGGAVTATAATTVLPTGSSLPFGVLQPFLTLNYIIALEGIFPSRN